jgi:hypothetical protein
MSTFFRRTTSVVCLLGGLLLSASSIFADTLRRVPILRTGIQSDYVSDIVVSNVYGPASSAPEIVACSNGSAFALSYDSGSYKTVWFTPTINCTAIAAADLDGDGATEVVVATNEGTGQSPKLRIYSPKGLGTPRTTLGIPKLNLIDDLKIANSDADAGLEIIVATSSDTYIFDAATLALEWTATGRGGTFVAVGDLENDGVPDIVLNGSDGHVLNGVTHAYKWGYAGGFGTIAALGDIDNDGRDEIVGVTYSEARVIQGETMASTTFAISSSATRLIIGDGNGDGTKEIIVGQDYSSLRGLSPSGTQLWAVTQSGSFVAGIAVGDVDGDGTTEVIWGSGGSSYGLAGLNVANPLTNTLEWSTVDLDGPFMTATGDLDRDGDLELVVVTRSTKGTYASGSIQIFDFAGNLIASFLSANGYYSTAVAVGQLDADAQLEIAVIEGYSGSIINVYDGVTYAKEWSSPSTNALMSTPLIVANVDGDPVDEIIVATQDRKVQVLNGASPILQGVSSQFVNYIYSIAMADIDSDGEQDLVVGTYDSVHVLRMSDLTSRFSTPAIQVFQVAATEGEFAFSSGYYGIKSYSGTTLQEQWSCSLYDSASALAYTTINGSKYLAMADGTTVQLYETGGSTCPAKISAEHPFAEVSRLQFVDVNGDGATELIGGNQYGAEVDLITLSSTERGDADNDGVRTDDDMDAIARLFFGDGKVPAAGADVNGDTSLGADDLFYLVNYRRGTGAAPPQ